MCFLINSPSSFEKVVAAGLGGGVTTVCLSMLLRLNHQQHECSEERLKVKAILRSIIISSLFTNVLFSVSKCEPARWGALTLGNLASASIILDGRHNDADPVFFSTLLGIIVANSVRGVSKPILSSQYGGRSAADVISWTASCLVSMGVAKVYKLLES